MIRVEAGAFSFRLDFVLVCWAELLVEMSEFLLFKSLILQL